ncbi:MAG: sugar transferase [[Clostridium] leptum]
MLLRRWEDLPSEMQNEQVRKYYDVLQKRQGRLLIKRGFDIVVSGILLVVLSPIFLMLAVAIKFDSPGPVFFRQIRVTQYNKRFRIFKFRSMIQNASVGLQVTVDNDARITRTGKFIRKYRLDEIPQLLDVFRGTMTFVGTRPEVPKYVEQYSSEMMATLLLPAGITSRASIYFKDEATILESAEDVDCVYVEQILPQKMKYNLKSIEEFSLLQEIYLLINTIIKVFGG